MNKWQIICPIAAVAIAILLCSPIYIRRARMEGNQAASVEPISRFVANWTNRQSGSYVYHSTGVPSSTDPSEAVAKLCKTGIRMPPITNLSVIEVRRLSLQEQQISRSLTNSAVALIATEVGQRVIHLQPASDVWWYRVYDPE